MLVGECSSVGFNFEIFCDRKGINAISFNDLITQFKFFPLNNDTISKFEGHWRRKLLFCFYQSQRRQYDIEKGIQKVSRIISSVLPWTLGRKEMDIEIKMALLEMFCIDLERGLKREKQFPFPIRLGRFVMFTYTLTWELSNQYTRCIYWTRFIN